MCYTSRLTIFVHNLLYEYVCMGISLCQWNYIDASMIGSTIKNRFIGLKNYNMYQYQFSLADY